MAKKSKLRAQQIITTSAITTSSWFAVPAIGIASEVLPSHQRECATISEYLSAHQQVISEAEEIDQLSKRWERETVHLSAVWQIREHPTFAGLVKFGNRIINTALDRVSRNANWHLVLLEVIQNPPDFSTANGDVNRLRRIWSQWAQQHVEDMRAENHFRSAT
jgi:hypothetical protein